MSIPANEQRDKHVIITSKRFASRCFVVIITCLLRCVFAGTGLFFSQWPSKVSTSERRRSLGIYGSDLFQVHVLFVSLHVSQHVSLLRGQSAASSPAQKVALSPYSQPAIDHNLT